MATKESKADFEKLLSKFDPKIRTIGKKTRALVLDVFPDAREKTYWGWANTWYGWGEKTSDAVFSINPIRSYVQLFFMKCTELPDPGGLLQGTGKKLRHINIHDVGELKSPALRRLMKRAIAHSKTEKPKR